MTDCPECSKVMRGNICSCGYKRSASDVQRRNYIPCGVCRGSGVVSAVFDPKRNETYPKSGAFRCACGNGDNQSDNPGNVPGRVWAKWGYNHQAAGWILAREWMQMKWHRSEIKEEITA